MKRKSPDVALLLRIFDESYERRTWHGPNLRGSLRGLTLYELCWRPRPDRHNIWEIVVHAAYWKYIVRRRLLGERRGSFPLKGSNWFVRPDAKSRAAWKSDLQLLEQTHRSLRTAISGITRSQLHAIPSGSTVSTLSQIYGIALHDVYHAGQIQLLKRLIKQVRAR